MNRPAPPDLLADEPSMIVSRWLGDERRVMLFGQSGVGKTTLAGALARALAAQGRIVWCLGADPGGPAFGFPGAVCLGCWRDDGWSLRDQAALCTLDAARFRLPLVGAVSDLARTVRGATLLLDTPGLVRGVAGAELLEALIQAAAIDLVLVLSRPGQPRHLVDELAGLKAEVVPIESAAGARRPSDLQRAHARTRLWDRVLADGSEQVLDLDALRCLGTPPRRAPEAWRGKLIAFLDGGRTRAMGEVMGLDGQRLLVRLPPGQQPTATLLVRDAGRDESGLIRTVKPFAADLVHYLPPPDVLPDALIPAPTGVRPLVQVGTAAAALVNGVFGDPLLHLRLRHQRRSLLFDLGEGSRLPARIAHQVTDVFITHAHADHIGGFTWLLRSRIGEEGVCRLYGPPGLIGHIQGFIAGFLWDRIGERGPLFEVCEVHDGHLARARLQAGLGPVKVLDERSTSDGILIQESGFRVRYACLDHGTPVLAFAFEPSLQINIREERLDEQGLVPGPWLTGLKQCLLRGDHERLVDLPDGRRLSVATLAADLTMSRPAERLVYATDFADTPLNRQRLIALADGAHTFFCEATFLAQDRTQAERTGHLTASACGEIARDAGVRFLIPFHFSRRYERDPGPVYAEIAAVCAQTVVPKQCA